MLRLQGMLGIFAVVWLAVSESGNAADWPAWRGPNRNGIAPDG